MSDENSGWYGFDLDGTLANYDGWKGILHIGEPIPKTVQRVKRYLALGRDCRIFTARVGVPPRERKQVIAKIELWCQQHIGTILPVTNEKDMGMIELHDDRAVQYEPNTGERIDGMSEEEEEAA